jgi:hypothetical protein
LWFKYALELWINDRPKEEADSGQYVKALYSRLRSPIAFATSPIDLT